MPVQILQITGSSDGDGRRRPKTDDYKHNDTFWLDRIANDKWSKDLGLPAGPGIAYRLDRLPDGYGGYEKHRGAGGGDSKSIDRYVFGHPKGKFRSMPEFYPHFKWLMEHEDPAGCTCKLCSGGGRPDGGKTGGARASLTHRSRASDSATQSPFFSQQQIPVPQNLSVQPKSRGRPRTGLDGLLQGRPSEDRPTPQRRRQVDEEGTPDILRSLLDRLQEQGSGGLVDANIVENMSPDWRTGHAKLLKTLKEWRQLPSYEPRHGEIVLFVRLAGGKETIGWDATAQTYRILDATSRSWLDRPKWEAGVVTQMATEPITDLDLKGTPAEKQHSVINSGFRIEPLPQANSVNKSYSKQHKYVHLHAIRPLCMWRDCLNGVEQDDWHPTIRHALTVYSSMCLIAKYHFKGTWPEATVFAQGLFIGPELIMVGDAVRLHPRAHEQSWDTVTDVLVITAIKMRIVNLDQAGDDDYDEEHPYTTCIHISGKAYTQEPSRSFDGVGRAPIPSDSEVLVPALRGLGTWYHVCDPKKSKARIEVPYQRVIGRCYEAAALEAWFTPPKDIAPPSSFQAVNSKPSITLTTSGDRSPEISRGLQATLEGRAYSQTHDARIDRDAGKTWFWADTRVQQLDLHEINNLPVGMKDTKRAAELPDWRRALKVLDGRRGGLEEYHAARRQKDQALARRENALGNSSSGLVAGGAQAMGAPAPIIEGATQGSDATEEDQEEHDAMEVDEPAAAPMRGVAPLRSGSSSSEMEVDVGNALAAFKARTQPVDLTIASDDEDHFMAEGQ